MADFRRIPLGDIDLKNEIRLNSESGVVDLKGSRGSVRRMYSARVDGPTSDMTVALYQGNAEEVGLVHRLTSLNHILIFIGMAPGHFTTVIPSV